MLELRPNCELCDADLPPASPDARICTYECTFCAACVENVLHDVCPNCGSRRIRHLGVGTQRVEDEVRAVVPNATLIRLDRDAVRAKGAHAAGLAQS